MSRLDFGTTEPRQAWRTRAAVVASIVFHVLLGWLIYQNPETVQKVEEWVEMTVLAPPPAMEELPPPPPEVPKPQPQKKKPKKVRADQTSEKPPPEADPGEVQDEQPVRRIQGLNPNSFGNGSGGFSVRAGTSLGVAATDETMTLDEAKEAVAYGAVAERPKCKKPQTRAPASAIEDELEGTVKVLFDVTADGQVTNVRILEGIRADIDQHCIQAWASVQCQPGRLLDNSAVMVTDMRYLCTYKGID